MGRLTGADCASINPKPHRVFTLQVSIAVPDMFLRLKKARVLPAASAVTGNSNPILRVRKKLKWDGHLGKCFNLTGKVKNG